MIFIFVKPFTIRLDGCSRGVRMMGSTKCNEVSEGMCVFDRTIPGIESTDRDEMVNFDPPSESFLMLLIRDPTDDAREVISS